MERIIPDNKLKNGISEIYQYRIKFKVFLYDFQKKTHLHAYKYKKTIDVLEHNSGDGNLMYKENSDADIDKIIEKYLERSADEREDRCESQEYLFVVNVHKFVNDYERQKLFFKNECNYADAYKNALRGKEIELISNDTTLSESGPEEKMSPEDRIRLLALYEKNDKERRNKKGFDDGELNGSNPDNINAGDAPARPPDDVVASSGPADPAMAPPPILTPAPETPMPPGSVAPAAQPAAKRSKVSLARQQAANAPMDST